MKEAESFFREKIKKIFTGHKTILDIGGGLRVDKKRNNRLSKDNAWIADYLPSVTYRVLDVVPDYHPDYIGDVHHLSFDDASWDAIVCASVLEHVENPMQACKELYRVLKPGGMCFVYVPFLYYYHAEKGYYKDYWRFTKDTIELLFKNFSHVEMQPVRGALATWVHMSPLGKYSVIKRTATWLDILLKKNKSNQVSGYYIFCVK